MIYSVRFSQLFVWANKMSIKSKFYLYLFLASILPIPILVYGFTGLELLAIILLGAYVALYFFIRRDFLSPLTDLQNWIKIYNTGQSVRLMDDKKAVQGIAKNEPLYDGMQAVLHKQIQRLSKKTASLETLYSISAKLNTIRSSDELFAHFLSVFADMTGASAGAARSLSADGQLALSASFGVIDSKGQEQSVLKSDCVCGQVAFEDDVRVQFSVHTCAKCVGEKSQTKANVGTIFIPLRHQGKTLGVFNLFFDTEPSLAFDERALFESIASNIDISLDKIKLDAQTKRLELSREGLFLSQEIHDSLAQTIYSLKLQVSALNNMLKIGNLVAAEEKVLNLQSNISQANQELRALMNNFRVPLDPEGIEVSLRNLVNRFKTETGITTHLHTANKLKIPPETELQIMRISQEALSNIRKHAKARNVRILLLNQPHFHLLIEDDGVGFTKNKKADKSMGNNIGMRIMQERADSIGAQIDIESDSGEGTRVMVTFKEAE